MAMHSIEPWIPEEWGSPVSQRVQQVSAVERLGRDERMNTKTKHVPRAALMGVDVIPKGGAYTEDDNLDDEVLLTARKFGRAISLDEDDIRDTSSVIDTLGTKRLGWATSYAQAYDNAALGVSGAENEAAGRPFTSVYQTVRSTVGSYTADTNYVLAGDDLGAATLTIATDLVTTTQPHGLATGQKVQFGGIATTTGVTAGTTYYVQAVPSSTTFKVAATPGGAAVDFAGADGTAAAVTKLAVSYSSLSKVLGLYETGPYYDPTRTVVIAAPSFLKLVRDVRDLNGQPIFQQGAAGTPDTLFGHEIAWSRGARVSTATTPVPTGNPLLVVAHRDLLIVGRRGPIESYTSGIDGVGWATDESKLKVRARRAFALGDVTGAAVLEAA